jgi:hypothetical protein
MAILRKEGQGEVVSSGYYVMLTPRRRGSNIPDPENFLSPLARLPG